MQTPLSFCDITARFGQTPAPQKSIAEQTGWNPNQLFRDYLTKVRSQREKDEKEAIEDALMEMVDAMNAPKWERTVDRSPYDSLLRISEQQDGHDDPTENPEIQMILAMARTQAAFRQVDEILNREEQEELQTEPVSETSETQAIDKEVK